MKRSSDVAAKTLGGRSRSVFVRDQKLSEIESALDLARLCLIVSPPLSGRSTLLQQAAVHLQIKFSKLDIRQIEIRTVTEFPVFLSSLTRLLEGHADQTSSLSQIISNLNDHGALLVVDNLDLVEGHEFFLDECLSKLDRGSLLASVADMPKLDPLKALDLRVVKDLRFSPPELAAWIEQIKISLSDQISLEDILQKTQGYASVIRSVFAKALIDNRSLTKEDLDHSSSELCERVFGKLKPLEQNWLREASFVACSPSLESKFLSALNPSTLQSLDAFGLVRTSADKSVHLSEDFKTYCKTSSTAEQVSSARQKIISECHSNLASVETREECVRQYIARDQLKEAAEILNSLVFDLSKDWRGDTIIELTNHTWLHLCPPAYFVRRAYHYSLRESLRFNIEEKLASELDRLIKAHDDPSKKAYFLSIAARNIGIIKHSAEAIKLCQRGIELAPADSEGSLWAQLTLQKYRSHIDANSAYQELLAIKDKVTDAKYSDLIRAYCYYELALIGWHLGLYEDIISFDNLAYTYFQTAKFVPTMQVTKGNRCFHLWGIGRLKAALPDIEQILEHFVGIRGHSEQKSYSEILISYRLEQGRLSDAKRMWLDHNSDLLPIKEVQRQYAEAYLPYFSILAREGAGVEVVESIDQVFRLSPELSERGSFVLRGLRQILNSPSLNQARSEVVGLIRNPGTSTSEDRINLLGLFLEQIWIKQVSIDLSECQVLLDELLKERSPVPLRIRARVYLAILKIFENDPKDSKNIFRDALEYYETNDIWIGQILCHLGLAILAFRAKDYAIAQHELSLCDPLANRIDSNEELYWIIALKAYAHALQGKHHELAMARSQVDVESSASDFLKFCLEDRPPNEASWWHPLIVIYHAAKTQESASNAPTTIPRGEILFDAKNRILKIKGQSVDLADRQVICTMLEIFLTSPGTYFDKETLVQKIWGESYNPLVHDTRIYTNIRRLRSLVEPLLGHTFISTRDGTYGYKSDMSL